MRALLLGLVVVSGCQCFVPVGEDGGVIVDAGRDGGHDAGRVIDGGCSSTADCTGSAPTVVQHCGSTTGVWSCASGRCVPECSNARTCSPADAGCLACNGTTQCLTPGTCPSVVNPYLEASTCGLQPGPLVGVSLSSQPCTYLLSFPDGGVLGTMSFYGFNDVSGNMPSLGGSCLGSQLPTGALRFSMGCPDCMLSIMP